MEPQFDPIRYHQERHTDKLPGPADRTAFVERIASPAQAIAEAVPAFLRALRSHPDSMLANVFQPNVLFMPRGTIAKFEFECSDGSTDPERKPVVTMRATTILDGSLHNEICVRLTYHDGMVKAVRDNHVG